MMLMVGGTGVLGRQVTRELLSRGERVRVFTRTPAKVKDLKQLGAAVVVGDLIDAASIERACQGASHVFAAAHSLIGDGRYRSAAVDDAGHRRLVDAAKAAGVRHFVYTSVLGAAPGHPVDFWRTKYHVEEYLKASGLTYTILRPSAFMEWHAHVFNGQPLLEKGNAMLLGRGTKLRNFVAVRDVAEFAVLALTGPALKNRTLEIGGPGNFSNRQVSELYARLAGLTPTIRQVPPGVLNVIGRLLKPFKPGISRLLFLSSLPDDAFDEQFDAAALLAEFPRELTTLEAFVRERLAERALRR